MERLTRSRNDLPADGGVRGTESCPTSSDVPVMMRPTTPMPCVRRGGRRAGRPTWLHTGPEKTPPATLNGAKHPSSRWDLVARLRSVTASPGSTRLRITRSLPVFFCALTSASSQAPPVVSGVWWVERRSVESHAHSPKC